MLCSHMYKVVEILSLPSKHIMPNGQTMYNLELLKSTTKALKLSEQWMLQVQEASADLLGDFFNFFL